MKWDAFSRQVQLFLHKVADMCGQVITMPAKLANKFALLDSDSEQATYFLSSSFVVKLPRCVVCSGRLLSDGW